MANYQYIKCPICGRREIDFTEIYDENSGEATRIVSKIGGKSAAKVAGQVVGGVVGDFFGVGEQVAALGGSVASYLAGNQIDKEFDKRKKPNRIICHCQSCNLEWDTKQSPQRILTLVENMKRHDSIPPKFENFVSVLIFLVVMTFITCVSWIYWSRIIFYILGALTICCYYWFFSGLYQNSLEAKRARIIGEMSIEEYTREKSYRINPLLTE